MFKWVFEDRKEAGILLADKLEHFKNTEGVILAVPRGGVPIAYYVARRIDWPLDLIFSKKIGHPLNPEFAIGSVATDTVTLDEHPHVSKVYIENEIARIKEQIDTKYKLYMGDKKPRELKGKNVIVIDDGIATGNTLVGTIKMLRKKEPARIIVAIPVLPYDRIEQISEVADEFVYLIAPDFFPGVGAFYRDFSQVDDEEVIKMLKEINDKKKDPLII
jgi:putative phosphoribosyl transferase